MLTYLRAFTPVMKARAKRFFTKQNGEVNIVVIVVLVAIALTLAIIFKDFIIELLEGLFDKIRGRESEI